MTRIRQLDRRTFLAEVGLGALAVVVLGAAGTACGGGDEETTTPESDAPADSAPGTSAQAGDPAPATGHTYQRVNLGIVSAYLLARDTQVALVDTGVEGSAGKLGEALTAMGRQWGDVRHVVLTHLHPDHIGSLAEVAGMAAQAEIYAGQADISGITSPRPVRPVADGDDVFGLRIVASPGHTAGHVAVLDPVASVLVVGDAIVKNPELSLSPPQFTADLAQAKESAKKLAALDPKIVLFGHGDPLEGGAGATLKEWAATL